MTKFFQGVSRKKKIVLGVALMALIGVGAAYILFNQKFSADVLSPKTEVNVTVATKVNPEENVALTLTNKQKSKVSLTQGNLIIADMDGQEVYRFPAKSMDLQKDKGQVINWNQKDSKGNFVPWGRYSLATKGGNSQITLVKPTFDIYGAYATATTNESGQSFIDNSGAEGDQTMFYFGLALKEYVKEQGNGSYEEGVKKLLGGNTSAKITVPQKVLTQIFDKAYASELCTAVQLGTIDRQFRRDWELYDYENFCLKSKTFSGTLSGTLYRGTYKRTTGEVYTMDYFDYRFVGTLKKETYVRTIKNGKINCLPKIETAQVNKTGTIYIGLDIGDIGSTKIKSEALCSFNQPYGATVENAGFDYSKCCNANPTTSPTPTLTPTPAPVDWLIR